MPVEQVKVFPVCAMLLIFGKIAAIRFQIFVLMELLIDIFLLIVLACLLMWCFRKLLWNIYKLQDICWAKKHPDTFPREEHIVFNKKTGKLEPDSRPILPTD